MARAPVTSVGGRIKVTQRGRLELDVEKLGKLLGAAAVGHVLERVDVGIDLNDKPFKPYTREYVEWLQAGGENPDQVDLRLTGGLLNSVKVKTLKAAGGGVSILIGPDTGTSEIREAGGTHAFGALKGAKLVVATNKNGTPKKGAQRMRKTGLRGPPHNLVGKYLSRKRPWLGVSPKGMKVLAALLARQQAFKGGA